MFPDSVIVVMIVAIVSCSRSYCCFDVNSNQMPILWRCIAAFSTMHSSEEGLIP